MSSLNFPHSLKNPLISINFICDWRHWSHPVPLPPPKVIQWLYSCTLLACFYWLELHISTCQSFVHMSWWVFLLHSCPNKTLTLKALFLFPICLVLWCPAIPSPPLPHFAASCQMLFLFVCLIVGLFVLCLLKLSPYSPFSLSSFHLSAWLVCHPVSLDGFILFPLNQNKPLSHEITHWSKSGPGLSNQIAEDF